MNLLTIALLILPVELPGEEFLRELFILSHIFCCYHDSLCWVFFNQRKLTRPKKEMTGFMFHLFLLFLDVVRCDVVPGCSAVTFWWRGGACESVGMKESTLVINENRPFMLQWRSSGLWPRFYNPILIRCRAHNGMNFPFSLDFHVDLLIVSVFLIFSLLVMQGKHISD